MRRLIRFCRRCCNVACTNDGLPRGMLLTSLISLYSSLFIISQSVSRTVCVITSLNAILYASLHATYIWQFTCIQLKVYVANFRLNLFLMLYGTCPTKTAVFFIRRSTRSCCQTAYYWTSRLPCRRRSHMARPTGRRHLNSISAQLH